MPEKDLNKSANVENDAQGGDAEQSAEAKAVAADTERADAEVTKLAADLEDLRQTLEVYRARNKKIRDELGLSPNAAIPK